MSTKKKISILISLLCTYFTVVALTSVILITMSTDKYQKAIHKFNEATFEVRRSTLYYRAGNKEEDKKAQAKSKVLEAEGDKLRAEGIMYSQMAKKCLKLIFINIDL